MDIIAIQRLSRASSKQMITVPAGQSMYQGHIVLTYPEYTGTKAGMIPFYEEQLKHYSESQINDVFHTLVSTIIYHKG